MLLNKGRVAEKPATDNLLLKPGVNYHMAGPLTIALDEAIEAW